jgi:dihydrofolate reductase
LREERGIEPSTDEFASFTTSYIPMATELHVRDLILQMQVSVDGYVAGNGGTLDWLVWSWDEPWTWDGRLRRYHEATVASADCIVLSGKMAEGGFIDHWAAVADDPDNPQRGFASDIANARKVLFSTTLEESRWDNTVVAAGKLTDEIAALKREPGRNILAFGGAGFATALIERDLVDEYQLIVNPTVLGSGAPIFAALREPLELALVSSEPYDAGIVVLTYRRNRGRAA